MRDGYLRGALSRPATQRQMSEDNDSDR